MRNGTYLFKTKPFSHQERVFNETRDLPYYALFWEQGCGKTKTTIDTAAYLFLTGKVDGLLLLAPNGVHENWVRDELPAHMPDTVSYVMLCYHSSKAGTKKFQQQLDSFEKVSKQQLAVLALSYDAFMTKNGRKIAEQFLKNRRCLYVLDESARIKSPSAKRTKAILASGKYAPYRRILTGTPVANNPFDVYTQMKFLHLEYWKPFYLDSFTVFRNHFGIWRKLDPNNTTPWAPAYCVGYRNLDQLSEIISKFSSRVTKEQVLDLPPKLYTRRYFDMTPEQWMHYKRLEEEFLTLLDSGQLVTAPLIITRLLRFQQITSGYLHADSKDSPVYILGGENPRLELFKEVLEDTPGKTIVWAKFQHDITLLTEAAKAVGRKPVRYDGTTSPDERVSAIQAFQHGDATDFIANPAAAGEGLTLHAASTVIYYNNSYNLTHRLQSEDRAHRIGQRHPVTYIDLVAKGTIDVKITDALVKKYVVAATVLKDEIKKWIRQ